MFVCYSGLGREQGTKNETSTPQDPQQVPKQGNGILAPRYVEMFRCGPIVSRYVCVLVRT
jgi:hypothetical protein